MIIRYYIDTSVFGGQFDAVKYMRKERDRISKEIADMTHEQIKEYFAKRRSKERIPGRQKP